MIYQKDTTSQVYYLGLIDKSIHYFADARGLGYNQVMKKLFFLLLLVATPANACSLEEIQNQRFAAVVDNICALSRLGHLDKVFAKELQKEMLAEYREIAGTERFAKVLIIMDKTCKL